MPDTRIGTIGSAPATSKLNSDGRIRPERFRGLHELRLAKPLGVTQFGVNLVTLQPGAWSSLRHWHEREDEFVYITDGVLTLVDDNGAHELGPGSFAAFPAGEPNGHHIQNRSDRAGSFIVIGSRRKGEETIHYPDDELGPVRA